MERIPYKAKYTIEDAHELEAWFEANRHRLPASLRLDPAFYIPNLPEMVDIYLENAVLHIENPTYDPAIYQLIRVREKLKEEWGERTAE